METNRIYVGRPTSTGQLMFDLYFKETGIRYDSENINSWVFKFPSACAYLEGNVVGFCYSKDFTPDILELRNIYVSKELRNTGLGVRLLEFFEELAYKEGYKGVVLANSTLFPRNKDKKLATGFYTKCGYSALLTTEDSRVYCKDLVSKFTANQSLVKP